MKGRRNFPLQSSALSKLQKDLNSVKYLIIDEFSVNGQKKFAWIKTPCKQATGLILCGDIAQLPPISNQVLYHNKPKNDLAVEGYCMYQKFQTVVKLLFCLPKIKQIK